MLSTWPHLPRWYAYGFPAVYILAAGAAVRIGRGLVGSVVSRYSLAASAAAAVLLVSVVVANLDVVGSTKPMELLLFQPSHWSYLWSR
jgi:hypothetical protein